MGHFQRQPRVYDHRSQLNIIMTIITISNQVETDQSGTIESQKRNSPSVPRRSQPDSETFTPDSSGRSRPFRPVNEDIWLLWPDLKNQRRRCRNGA